MDNLPKEPSLDNYFSAPAQNDNFFDQLSTNRSSDSQLSAMMSSMVESKSNQDLFASVQSQPVDGLSDRMSELGLESNAAEAAQNMFASDVARSSSFFDTVDSGSSETIFSYDVNDEGPYPSPLQGFEDMSEVLNGVECDRTREAWIPSEETRRALIQAATSPPGTWTPEEERLTRPVVVLETELSDTVGPLVRLVHGESEAATRKVLTMNDVSADNRGLRELLQSECYRAAVNLSAKLLAIFGQGPKRAGQPSKHSTDSIQIWFTRLSLLVKLQEFTSAEAESNPWWDLDKPDLYYQFYPDRFGGKLGTMVPFQMRVLIAHIPAFVQKYSVALSRLYSILAVVRRILSNLESGKAEDGSLIELGVRERQLAKQLWSSREARVQHSVVNVALLSKNYVLAIEVLQNLIKSNRSINQKRALHSALGRIFLQLGDVSNAETCFTMAKKLKRAETGRLSSSVADLRELVDRGLVSVAQNDYQEAYEHFHKASLIEPTNVMVLNNVAVCLFYSGKFREALDVLTSTIQTNPSLALHESLLLNLCTLYELDSSQLAQKEALLRLIAKYKGDSVNVSCLKLPHQPPSTNK